MPSDEPEPLAVLVPTLNEADRIVALLHTLQADDFDEIIVVDGGSSDGTTDLARSTLCSRLTVVEAPRGRGRQLAAALRLARTPLVLMLHADTSPPPGTAAMVRRALGEAGVAGGCFRLRFDRPTRTLSAYAWATRFDCRLTSFGDAAIFARRSVLMEAGGIPDWPLLEDVEIRRRLKRVGRFVKIATHVTTSARRFERVGALRMQALNALVLSLHFAGVGAERLARLYGHDRK